MDLRRISHLSAVFACVSFVLAWGVPQFWGAFLLLGAALTVASLAIGFVHRRRSRYDLNALRVLHESGGAPPSGDDLPEIPADAGVVCPCCGNVYAAWMLVCPKCRR